MLPCCDGEIQLYVILSELLACLGWQLAELLTAVDLDVDEQERNFPIISDYACEIRRLIPTDT